MPEDFSGRAELFAGAVVFRDAFVFFALVDVRRRAVFDGALFWFASLFSFFRFLDFFGTIGLFWKYSVTAPSLIGK